MNKASSLRIASVQPARIMIFWRIVQGIFWLIGLTIFLLLLFKPSIGLTLLWNVLIPIAPALLVVGAGFWRNVCPLATTALLPDRLRISKSKKLSSSQRVKLNLVGIILLLVIIPSRHLLFNVNGYATVIIILAILINALIAGFLYERKSGWCSGLCPIHPVEKLYGSGVAFSLINAHCGECVKCSVPCPDSTPNFTPLVSRKFDEGKAIEILLIGGFPGYIWGWFQVPDYTASFGWMEFLTTYAYPVLGAALSIFLYVRLKALFPNHKNLVLNLFAAAAVSCYYWFRLPMLFGFSLMDTNGILVNLTNVLPAWSMIVLNIATTGFFVWWMMIRKKKKLSWAFRPVYANA